jgi:hypothetical protein
MYAHQVIECGKETLQRARFNPPPEGSENWLNFWKLGMEGIKKAQMFHMGDVAGYKWMAEGLAGGFAFEDESLLRLPYSTMWFESHSRDDAWTLERGEKVTFIKDAFLVQEMPMPGVMAVIFFSYIKEMDVWLLHPVTCVIAIGGWTEEKKKPFNFNNSDTLDGLGIPTIMCRPMVSMEDREQTMRTMKPVRPLLIELELFLRLLNCKNIVTENHTPDAALNKSRRKKGRQELFTYKTLAIKIPKEAKKHIPSEATGEHNRIHLCRGHIKNYTAEAPLFGRIVGSWWWQPIVRGQNRDGVVMKDYKVKSIQR